MTNYTTQQFDDAYDAMIECALWSSHACGPTQDDEPIEADSIFDESHIDPDILTELRGDLRAFMEDNGVDLSDMNVEQIGHDFWLTRNHHGAGFWDRGLADRGTRLTEACRPYGEIDLQLYYRYDEEGEPCPA